VLSLDRGLSLSDNAQGFALGLPSSPQFISCSFSLQKYAFIFFPSLFMSVCLLQANPLYEVFVCSLQEIRQK